MVGVKTESRSFSTSKHIVNELGDVKLDSVRGRKQILEVNKPAAQMERGLQELLSTGPVVIVIACQLTSAMLTAIWT